MFSNLINKRVLREVLLFAFIGLVILTLIPFGSVTPFPFAFAAIGMFVLAIISGLLFREPRQSRWVFSIALFLLVVLAGWAFIQTTELPANWLANPAWNAARDLAGAQSAAISVEPADTLASILWVALPFVTFLTGLLLCDTDQRARKVLTGLGLTAGIIAVFGLMQFLLFPKILIVVEKHAYLDSLTAVFVNRNTAATFLGLGTLLMLTLVRDITRAYSKYPPGEPGRNALLLRSWIYILFLCACFTALMLSRSRAGIFATFVAALVYFPWLVINWNGSRRHLRPAPRWRSLLKLLSAIAFVVLLLTVFAGQAILRAQERRLEDDDRFCILPGIWRAVSDHWLTGTGLGTFRTVFSAYRDPACGIFGVFDRAHNFYLEGFLGLGILFPIATVLALSVLARVFWHGLAQRRRLRHYVLLGLAATVLVALHAAVDFSLQIPGFAVFYSAFLSAVVAICLGRSNGEADMAYERPLTT
ncbi:O-antigen ligase family protein [Rhizobium leguminosarum]|uniref:Endo-1,4-beta-xylanase protein (Exopolysaccharide export) n=1 Tax=Rhizobium leguminosarum bv. trifolii (strain WSM1325) TaxID=395491 RepID=C6ATZ0_RHILS|nr:O-antigen ligase family protein [Rhizobium leguminosarum]ACS57482.1 endo-1,4-beta-xylanase protein (exopolysaccharide export) [Rhizobium leguminosarum bv. trifolii WSM1325]MBY2905758.1 O-antigen ligase family protein [Rhizobium leguminosarum]MBY2941693.1 O-antigen ligase family protein [Rhizobium leguminosarum]MBY2945315.1 O-antigen ligase family protein [Rhizobium leguminosarum]MBY2990109.1 O-antigen ligase family protein [Rhizobium leguminosarum]